MVKKQIKFQAFLTKSTRKDILFDEAEEVLILHFISAVPIKATRLLPSQTGTKTCDFQIQL